MGDELRFKTINTNKLITTFVRDEISETDTKFRTEHCITSFM